MKKEIKNKYIIFIFGLLIGFVLTILFLTMISLIVVKDINFEKQLTYLNNCNNNNNTSTKDSLILESLKNNEYTCLSYNGEFESLDYSYTGLSKDCLNGRCKNTFYRWDENFKLLEIK